MNIFLDLSKALYELEHSIILQKFKYYGVKSVKNNG